MTMIKATMLRQEAEALIDAVLRDPHSLQDNFAIDGLISLALACGMIRSEGEFPAWLERQLKLRETLWASNELHEEAKRVIGEIIR